MWDAGIAIVQRRFPATVVSTASFDTQRRCGEGVAITTASQLPTATRMGRKIGRRMGMEGQWKPRTTLTIQCASSLQTICFDQALQEKLAE